MRHNTKNIETSYPLDRNGDSSNKSTTQSQVIKFPYSNISIELTLVNYIFLHSLLYIRGLSAAKGGRFAANRGRFMVKGVRLAAIRGLSAAKRVRLAAIRGLFFVKGGLSATKGGRLVAIRGLFMAERGLISDLFSLLLFPLFIAAQQSIQYIIGFRWHNHYSDWFRPRRPM